MDMVKGAVVLLCTGGLVIGLWGATPALAQKRSVAEEILDILKADNKISDQQYQDLMAKARAENEQREAGVEAFRRDPVKDVKQSVDWLNRFTFFGDIRTRVEGFSQDKQDARIRERIRLRFGATMKITDEVMAGLRLASGDPNNPVTRNQTLGDGFTGKTISIDQADITLMPKKIIGLDDIPWTPITITAGKFANPAFRPRAILNSELIWDDDLTPEGASETFTSYEASEGLLRRLQFNLMQWVVRESPFAHGDGSWMFGGQGVSVLQLHPRVRLTLAMADYGYMKSNFMAQLRNSNNQLRLTNSVVLNDGTVVIGGNSISPGATPAKQIKSYFGNFN